MWRAVWIAIGIAVFLFGAEFLLVERLVFAGPLTTIGEEQQATPAFSISSIGTEERNWAPPEWLPWTAMSAGAIVVLYSITATGSGGNE